MLNDYKKLQYHIKMAKFYNNNNHHNNQNNHQGTKIQNKKPFNNHTNNNHANKKQQNFNRNKNNLNNHQNNKKQVQKEQLIDLKCHTVQELYEIAEQHYAQLKSSTKNDKWNEFISQKGTKKDKITFIASEIIKKPQSSLQNFELLTKWTLDSNHNFALPACQALTNIYIEHIFVQKHSLKVFLDSVQEYIKVNKKDTTVKKGDLVGYYLEHHIKHFYGQMLRGITELLTSTVSHIKKISIQLLSSLSRFKQMRRLLFSTLVNKFGDSDLQIVNQVSKSLKNQFYEDILASQVLVQEAQAFLFRQNLAEKSQFYVINFLNNINLKFFSQKSLTKLFELYFHFFNKLMNIETEQKSISSRFFLNSIKGLNKIFAYMKTGNKQSRAIIEEKVEKVYKTFHKTQNTKAKVQLLLFLFQSCTIFKGSISDRFYRILYEFLSTNEIIHCSIAEMFFDLLLISMKQDQNMNRTLAFIKRLFQLCFEAESNFIATCLILVGKVIQEKQSIKIMLRQKENSLEEQQDFTKEEANAGKNLPYDMNKREPLYAGAEKTNLWQLTVFKNHYHPTVRKFAEHILKNEEIPYEGSNPLIELSLTSFVQKLSLRKQKKSDSWKIKVKRNLSKIRTSKYQSLLDKPLHSFKEDEEFVRKYLQKREKIHQNKNQFQAKNIEEFADHVIQKQMDRLNAKDQSLDDLSISQQGHQSEGDFQNLEGQAEQILEQEQGQDALLDKNLQGDEDIDSEADEFGDYDNEEFGDDEQDGEFNDELDGQMDEQDFDEDESQMQEEDQSLDESKSFEDVFDDIGDSPQYLKKKNKSKGIQKIKDKFKDKNASKINKKANYKSMKKQLQKNHKNSFKSKNKKR